MLSLGGNAFRNAFGQLGGPGKSAENVMQVQAELKDHRTKVGLLFDLSPSSPVSFFPAPTHLFHSSRVPPA